MTKKRDQDDDWNRHAEKQKQNGTHGKLLMNLLNLCAFNNGSFSDSQLNKHDVIPLSASDGSGEAGAERTDQQSDECPE